MEVVKAVGATLEKGEGRGSTGRQRWCGPGGGAVPEKRENGKEAAQ